MKIATLFAVGVAWIWLNFETAAAADNTLEQQLQKEEPSVLARAARQQGDATRGAILFHQQHLACTKCHTTGEPSNGLGPDLARRDDLVTDTYLIESLLQPSKVIRKGYEPITILTTKGLALSGVLHAETPRELVVRDAAQDGKLVTLARADIEERRGGAVSLMPAGLVNQLGNRQEFLDLVRYLMEIGEQGPQRAQQLRPPPALFAAPPLPEYEKTIDHAGMIADLDSRNFQRGEAIYQRLCVNCHGTKEAPGSLPTSLAFASGKFKNGSDPYSMYQTLTRGFGMMVPQTWMVPRQKYDVIHYVREAYLKEVNPTQYVRIDQPYLERLPRGSTRGPQPSTVEPWVSMDYGPSLIATYEIGNDHTNLAYKGIAVRLDAGPGGVSRGQAWMLFDHDTLRLAAAWSGPGFIDWNSIHFNGRHEVHPRIVGKVHWANPIGPGWANPADGSFHDPRPRGRDGRPYGPLPRAWAHYKGLYHHGQQVFVSYTVGAVPVLEMPGLENVASHAVFSRMFNIGPRPQDMVLQVAHQANAKARLRSPSRRTAWSERIALFGPEASPQGAGSEDKIPLQREETGTGKRTGETRLARPDALLLAGLSPYPTGAKWITSEQGDLRLQLPAGSEPLQFTLSLVQVETLAEVEALVSSPALNRAALDLTPLTQGGPARWTAKLTLPGQLGKEDGPFAVDTLTHPAANPWFCQMRLTGLEFLPGGTQAVVCSWDGDVWLVSGVDRPERGLTWQRIASGLFQPLGLKVVAGRIYVGCRDQIVILHDRNGDGEIDFYENFNNDHQVTEHFHEFAMGLQVDAQGNFYYSKGARHAKTALVPHHGTLLRVAKDGSRTDILATGFRAANGVCLNADGTFFLTDQEGHWTPKNRLNWVREGGFYGNMWGYHDITDPSDRAMQQPLCWITNRFDRSPAEMLWVNSNAWGPLNGALLNLSYGYGKIFVVPHEKVHGQMQGGMCPLPMPALPTGLVRGRFHPDNGQLYACGLFAWAGSQQQAGGLYRIRYTGKPVYLPIDLRARPTGLTIAFSGRLDPATASDPRNYSVKTWALRRTEKYGSEHLDEKPSRITSARLAGDGKTVFLELPELKPTWCMELTYSLTAAEGERVEGVIHNTVHQLGD